MTVIFALAAPVLMLFLGGAIDISRYRGTIDELQSVADFSSIAGAREMTLANAEYSKIKAVVENAVAKRMESKFADEAYTSTVNVDMEENEVTVNIEKMVKGLLGQSLFPNSGHVKVDSIAVATGSISLCAISLDDMAANALSLQNAAELNADGCSMYANSTDSIAFSATPLTEVTAELVCSAGGISNTSINFDATEVTDCPAMPDPLADRDPPAVPGYCDEVDFVIDGSLGGIVNSLENTLDLGLGLGEALGPPVTIYPGVYCGGLRVLTFANATFMPGIYIIKDGPLEIDLLAEAYGENVSFYFSGTDAVLDLGVESAIEFSAPETGPMAGILFMEDENNPADQQHTISSRLARELLGTTYLPRGTFLVDSTQPVSQNSAYTVVIANQIKLSGAPSLFLNTDYSSTNVPVPEGVGPINGSAYLRN